MIHRINVIDSHTGGEPTRVIMSGFPELKGATLAERRLELAREFDHFRSAINNEPRSYDAVVSALLTSPVDPTSDQGVIFFNNEGVLNMCGHGTIGVAETLRHIGRYSGGTLRLETPVGVVEVIEGSEGAFTFANVPSYRFRSDVSVEIPGYGAVTGDIAWGGNWFFLVADHGKELTIANIRLLSDFTIAIMEALAAQGITGEDGGKIDHIELFGSAVGNADSRNFVMCPGGAYDRSPCGTGTSAKVACLFASGKLEEGQVWRQESITGSVFEAKIEVQDGKLVPWISGRAYINAEATLILNEEDPLCWGIR